MTSQHHGLFQTQAALLKSYSSRLKNDVRSMLENFQEIARLGMYDESSQLSQTTRSDQDSYEIHVRAENMVRAGESLMKLIADMKQYLILNDFAYQNDILDKNDRIYRIQVQEMDLKLIALRDDASIDLYDLEEDYYMSNYKQIAHSANVNQYNGST